MKNTFFLSVALFLFSAHICAQSNTGNDSNTRWKQNTVFKPGETSHGGYGALTLRMGELNDKSALMIGGKGAWVINHSLGIGLAGTGVMGINEYDPNSSIHIGYAGGFGGFLIEPILFSDKLVHVSIPMILGGGGVSRFVYNNNNYNYHGGNRYVAFGLFEPGIEIEFNMVSWFRISAGAYYAFRTEIDSYLLDTDILSPFSFGINFKFGSF